MDFRYIHIANITAIYSACLVTLLVAIGLVVTQNWHAHLSVDDHIGIQKFHINPTPRVGGLAIFFGVLTGYFLSTKELKLIVGPLLQAGALAFGLGLLEDITKKVSVRSRLMATMACGILGWAITGFSINRANTLGLDWLLGFTLISVAFTALAVGGVANAINIIDGFNGLAAGTVIIILSGYYSICLSVNDPELATACLILIAVVAGFFLLNWPYGKLFMGDGGAYFLGFSLAWLAVLILARHSRVSAWAPLLVCGYPIMEVGFSIMRRRFRGLNPGAPDRLHLHSLVKRRLVRRLLPKASKLTRNSTTGAVMWLVALVPTSIALLNPFSELVLLSGFGFCVLLYALVYARLVHFNWNFLIIKINLFTRSIAKR